MKKYNPEDFINSLRTKTNVNLYKCPFCGKSEFTTTENYFTLPISNDFDEVKLGPNIPAGMLVCQNCGHIEYFALGVLGLLDSKDNNKNEEK